MQKLALFACLLFAAQLSIGQEDLKHWFHADPSEGYNGVSTAKSYKLLKGKASTPVVVAIIDSGVDIEHEDLADNIWTNPGEIAGNGIDDDKNGYIDDVHGWNFIGGPNGRHVGPDTYEVTRLYGKYKYKFEKANPAQLNKKDRALYDQWLTWKEEVVSKRAGAQKNLDKAAETENKLTQAFDALENVLIKDSIEFSKANIEKIQPTSQLTAIGRQVALNILNFKEVKDMAGIRDFLKEELERDAKDQKKKIEVAYNPDFDPRKNIVMDNYADQNERYYGNNDVEGPDALHGTHVAGIVGAVRGNDIGMDGVADNVQIMSIRTVPDGDERDKDVANAIRYAVDNGASIINMSFGKGHSWNEKIVEDAIKYAEKNDVLMVHAAGNSELDIDVADNFPNDSVEKGWWIFKKHKPATNWISVGALSYKKGEESVATFSNYAADNVDLFAPGVQIYATLPGNEYTYLQGTSMAAPVVAGVATVLRSYFPSLTAQQVKEILMTTTVPLNYDVNVPGTDTKKPFSQLSQTGGVVNLYNAVTKAMQTKGKKKIKKKKTTA